MTTIICAVDESGGASDALATAAEVARRAGAELLIVHVHEADVRTLDADALEAARDHAKGIAKDALLRYDTEMDATCMGLVGQVGDALEDLAEREGSVAIVLGARSRGRAGFTFRSRTARHLADVSGVPVLIAPARPALILRASGPDRETRPAKKRLGRRQVRTWAETTHPVRPRPMSRP